MTAFIMFDPLYFIILAPAMLLAGWAQMKVKGSFARASQIPASSRLSGAEAAYRILQAHGLQRVGIEPTRGMLGDHYDPQKKVLRLSPNVYSGRSLAAVGVAAHEAGHAIQDASGYAPLKLRNGIVPLASAGGNLSMIIFMIGFLLASTALGQGLLLAGVLLFSLTVLFQLINLPVEFDASRRARRVLVENGVIAAREDVEVGRVLNAAAMTYVAATIGAMLTLVYLLIRSGLLGGRRD
ncbi:MAG: zinc metallopeptidase [Phycisphaerae bacterium]|nr:zinc metallopeptidase [Phycisphaerae bacterium]